MNKIIAGMLFMAFAGSAIAASQPVLSQENAKRLQELKSKSRNVATCRALTAECLRLTPSEFKEYLSLRPSWKRNPLSFGILG